MMQLMLENKLEIKFIENKAKDATPTEDIKSANEDLSRQNQIMAKRKNAFQVRGR